MDDRFILYLGGGAMSGVFGAGVLTTFERLGLQERVEAIYAGSAGAFNGAYFLSGQGVLGSSIYYEDLIEYFIIPRNVALGIAELVWNRLIRPIPAEKIHNVINIDYLFEVIQTRKPLDVEKLKKQTIPLYVKVLNIDKGEIVYIDARTNPIPYLKAAVSTKPYYFKFIGINGHRYVDGTIKEPVGLTSIFKKHPGRKMVVVLNEPIERGAKHYVKNYAEGLVASLYPYSVSLLNCFINREQSLRNDIKIALASPNVLLIYPPKNNQTQPRTTNKYILLETYKMGIEEGNKITNFL